MTDRELTDALKGLAFDLGFTLAGVAPAVRPDAAVERLGKWIDAGYAGEMAYFAERREAYEHPARVLRGARSVLMLALVYRTTPPQPTPPGAGRVARNAWGDLDYHDVVRPKLHRLCDRLRELRPHAAARGVIDTAPLLERDFAVLAGLGWVGKNTLLLNKSLGSYFFLAAVVTDADLVFDAPHATDHCGTCRACLEACPTGAFVEPRVLDATRCISYLTIEASGLPPRELRAGVGEWLFGCDVCQDVCPWNRRPIATGDPALAPGEGMDPVELAPLFALDERAFRARFRASGLWRAKREGVLRNAALVLGATRPPGAEHALTTGLNDTEALVRGAAAWGLGRIGGGEALAALRARRAIEPDAAVLAEIDAALAEASG